MFFVGIFGIQEKIKEIKEFNNVICACGRYSRLKLIEQYTYFHFFFIPIFKWNRRYYVEARCCGRVFEVPEDYVEEALRSDSLDIGRLREVSMPYKVCANCGRQVDSSFTYCPYCGSKS